MKRDFEALYRAEADPWAIGPADSPRYDGYVRLVLEHARSRGSLLDIGCGQAGFLSRFETEFARLVGVDVSATALERARQRLPHAEFVRGSAGALDGVVDGRFDFVICSDVLYYLPAKAREKAVAEIAGRLAPHGRALVAAWAPGGRYLTPRELRALVSRHLRVEHEELLESGHAVFVTSPKRMLAAVTVDYETWQPIPADRTIDWERDVFRPAAELLDLFDQLGARLTFFAEMGEYFWLDANEPELARRMEEQWRDAMSRGHDVQLHLHPNWLPELGARRLADGWSWNEALASLDAYPGDLETLIRRCCERLTSVLAPVQQGYRPRCFRAGGYRVQPFRRLREALLANGIDCDTSVYAGGVSEERGYDYRHAWSAHQPYYAAAEDPQLAAPPAEERLVELPIFTFRPGQRWFLDGPEGPRIAQRLLGYVRRRERARRSPERERLLSHVRAGARALYSAASGLQPVVNRVLPRRLLWLAAQAPEPQPRPGHDYFVMVGHTKAPHDLTAIASALGALVAKGVEFVTLSEMAASAREELEAARRSTPFAAATAPDGQHPAKARWLSAAIPLDRELILDLAPGGQLLRSLGRERPWTQVATADGSDGPDGAPVGDVAPELPFPDGAFDCVCVHEVLESVADPESALREMHRVLADRGALVGTLRPEAHEPSRACAGHRWRTTAADLRVRLERSAFVNVTTTGVDALRALGEPPHPASHDGLVLFRAWKRTAPATELERALEAMAWVYGHITRGPSPFGATRAEEFLTARSCLCWGYAVALGELLRAEGYPVTWITMLAHGHSRGRGRKRVDSHEVLEVVADGRTVLLDPTCNTFVPWSLEEVLADPSRAAAKTDPDANYVEHGYHLYDNVEWYRLVRRVARRSSPRVRIHPWTWRRVRPGAGRSA